MAGFYRGDMELDEPLVLDGGLGTQLEARGGDLSGDLWSARFLASAPEEIVAAHEAFFAAGADIVTTASYQAGFAGFAAHGFDREHAAGLMRRSVELAKRAAQRDAGKRRLVAASVGPYGAVLPDGSEFRGRYGLSHRELVGFHRPRLEVLAEAGPDLLALETVPDVDEAAALLEVLGDVDVPAWLSYNIDGERTRAGQPLEEAFAVAAGRDDVLAVGINCCTPADATRAVPIAREMTGKPVVVYPNSGEGWNAGRQDWTGPSRFDAALVRDWVAAGARIVGGCCRVAPADINAVANVLARPRD